MKTLILVVSILSLTGLAFAGGTIVKTSFYSDSLGATRSVNLYLPENYDPQDSIHYPVVYFLHGYFYTHDNVLGGAPYHLEKALGDLIGNQMIQPVIAVAPDGSTQYWGGCWYSNSVLYGDYEDYIVYDLVDFVEENYKAIPVRERRFISGHSMGGYGSMKFGLKHPDIYRGLVSHSGAFEFWTFFNPYWKIAILNEYSGPPYAFHPNAGQSSKGAFSMCGAFSPNMSNPPFFVDFILDSSGNIDPAVKAAWELHNPAYLATLFPSGADLAIYFDCGDLDQYRYHEANEYFSQILNSLNIPHVFESYVGGHYDKIEERERIGLQYLDSVMQDVQLVSDSESLSASAGGLVYFYLSAGWDNAKRNYLIVGGVTGTIPGTPLPGGLAVLPINWDVFSDLEMVLLNTNIFSKFASQLNEQGLATAVLNVPPIPPSAVGITMNYAFCCNNLFDFVSNPIPVEIIP